MHALLLWRLRRSIPNFGRDKESSAQVSWFERGKEWDISLRGEILSILNEAKKYYRQTSRTNSKRQFFTIDLKERWEAALKKGSDSRVP